MFQNPFPTAGEFLLYQTEDGKTQIETLIVPVLKGARFDYTSDSKLSSSSEDELE